MFLHSLQKKGFPHRWKSTHFPSCAGTPQLLHLFWKGYRGIWVKVPIMFLFVSTQNSLILQFVKSIERKKGRFCLLLVFILQNIWLHLDKLQNRLICHLLYLSRASCGLGRHETADLTCRFIYYPLNCESGCFLT